MALSRALLTYAKMRTGVKIQDPLVNTSPAAKGKPTKQYQQTGPKAKGPQYRQDKGNSEEGSFKLGVI